MTTRFNVHSDGLHSGYDNKNYSTLEIPSCGVEDVDRALFYLFDKELKLAVTSQNEIIPVKTIFAAGEKWAVIKKKKDIRDRNGRLILPLITIGRTSIEQSISDDITGRGINQQTGELIVKRRLFENADRNYQNLINRLLIVNQTNIPTMSGTFQSNRDIGDFAIDPDIKDGAWLKPVRNKNVWETITIPAPQFFSAHYEITIWTQYTEHMNQIVESIIAAQLPQGNAFKIANPIKGYWFIARIDDNTFNPNNNWDDMFEQDRVIKYEFTMTVPGYVLAPKTPNSPLAIRRYISIPQIEFGVSVADDLENVNSTNNSTTIKDPWLGADDPTLPIDHINSENIQRLDARLTDESRLDAISKLDKNDPVKLPRGKTPDQYMKIAIKDNEGNIQYKHVKVRNVNKHTGESVISAGDFSLDGISVIT